MKKIYTKEDLILYAYNETELTDTVLIQNSIDGDPLVEDEYKELLNSIALLDKVMHEPDEEVMNRLMCSIEALKLQ